jgi:hypothetical protein
MTDLRKAAEAKAREMGNTRCHHGDGYQFECDDCVANALVEFAEERYDTEEVERTVAEARREEREACVAIVENHDYFDNKRASEVWTKPLVKEMRRRRESEQ